MVMLPATLFGRQDSGAWRVRAVCMQVVSCTLMRADKCAYARMLRQTYVCVMISCLGNLSKRKYTTCKFGYGCLLRVHRYLKGMPCGTQAASSCDNRLNHGIHQLFGYSISLYRQVHILDSCTRQARTCSVCMCMAKGNFSRSECSFLSMGRDKARINTPFCSIPFPAIIGRRNVRSTARLSSEISSHT
jgi:hypothetical protein